MPHVSAPPPADPPTGASPDERNVYKDYVFRAVGAQKMYPRLARKRRIEGLVVVVIEIDSDGSLSEVRSSLEAPRVLGRATEEAIRRAAPFRAPPGGPVTIELPLSFSLDDLS